MATTVTTEDVTDVRAPFDFGPAYNDIDATVFVPAGADSIFVGGPNVDDGDNGVEWLPESEHKVTLKSGNKLYRVASTGVTVTIKILNTGN